ncbi:hypothetical protein [Cyanobium sp. NIES-981]|uniref:hypothetical protein n=1 Tax=Cyanobium sp. NIES-981 TaxID=1851505 RepID=UPI0007DDD107|nr:hypothetical protein [Cyanobium sp. NIES-981]SBO42422.1 conserved protein of unknown function [Cyanobium sp. NIES-981]
MGHRVRRLEDSLLATFFRGLLIVVPAYLSFLLVVKAMKAVGGLVQPVALVVPDSLPVQKVLSLLLLAAICLLVGFVVATPAGQLLHQRLERRLYDRIPGYSLFRSLFQQLLGTSEENVWKPAFFESDEGLLPAFIIEEFADGRFTVFVPSIPTPFAGAVFIVDASRVHPLDVPFTDAMKSVARWGSGSEEMVKAFESKHGPLRPRPLE